MHLRRAVLLFAIVLGLAAVAASFSRERTDEQSKSEGQPTTADRGRPPTAAAAPAGGGSSRPPLRFDVSKASRSVTIDQGSAGVVEVRVPSPGLVGIEGLGLTASAEPLTPARFDVLVPEPGRHALVFTPAGGEDGRRVGVLVVRSRESS